MKLNCPECGTPVLAGDINLNNLMAKCGNCHSVFSFENGTSIKNPDIFSSNKRAIVPLPNGIIVDEKGDSLIITMSWFRWSNLFLTFFTLFWDCFMIAWFTISIATGAWPMAIFGLLHGGVGIFLTYKVLANYINKTIITISRQLLTVKIGPLPWSGNISISSTDIIQLYTKRVVSRGRNTTIVSFEVHGVLNNRAHISIVKALDESEQAFYIEQKIEDFLQIEDEPVRGEMEK